MEEIVRDTERVYGEKETRLASTAGAVDLLLLSEKLDKRRIFIECAQCHRKEEKNRESG